MLKKGLLVLFLLTGAFCAKSQVMVTKIVGKYASQSQLGWGVFAFYDFPLFQSQNQSLRVELMDFAFFPCIVGIVSKDSFHDTLSFYMI